MLLQRNLQRVNFLKKVPLFSGLSQRHLREISKHADELQVETGEVLAKQGATGLEFFFIVEGKAKVEKNGKFIRQLSGGDFFGEIALIDGKRRAATVTAETDMTVLIVYKKSFSHLLDTIPGLQEKILLALCDYVRRAEEATNKE